MLLRRSSGLPRLIALACTVGVSLACAPAALGAGAWGTVETVSRLPAPASAAIDDRGYSVLVWSRGDMVTRRVYGARRTPTRGFGEPFGLHTAGQARTWRSVTFDTKRNALVAWSRAIPDEGNRIESRAVRANGARTDTATVAEVQGRDAQFAAVAAGTFAPRPVLTWRLDANRAIGLATARDGRLLDSEVDELPDTDAVSGVATTGYALEADGTLVAAYTEGAAVVITERSRDGSFTEPTRLPGRGPGDARIALGPQGTVAVAWSASVEGGPDDAAFVASRPPGGQFGAPTRVSAPEERALDIDVAVTTDGAVRVAYLAARYDDIRPIGAVRLATLGGGNETLTPPGLDASDAAIGADGRGGTTVAWQRSAFGTSRRGNAIFARAITPSDRVGKRWKLTRTGEDGRDLTLAVGPDGSALAAWTSGEGLLGDRLRAIRRARTGP
jgi:hypothetical protein